MKVYTLCVFDMATGETLEEQSYEYSGPVALCGGGGGNSYDPEYNKRMADIAEDYLRMAERQDSYWETGMMPQAPTGAAGDFYDRRTNATVGAANGYYVSPDGKYIDKATADTLGPKTLNKAGFQWVESSSFNGQGAAPVSQAGAAVPAPAAQAGQLIPQVGASGGVNPDQGGYSPTPINTGGATGVPGYNPLAQIGSVDGYNPLVGPASQMKEEQLQREINRALIPMQGDVAALELAGQKELTPMQTELSKLQISGLQELTPMQTELSKTQLQTETGLVPLRGEVEGLGLNAQKQLIPEQTNVALGELGLRGQELGNLAPVMSEYYRQTLEGIDPRQAMTEATADVLQANDVNKEAMLRQAMNQGIQPGTAAWNQMMKDASSGQVMDLVTARSNARTAAKDKSYGMLTSALGRL